MTRGEYKVGVNFNPSGQSLVDEIKQRAAQLIDLIELIPPCPEEYMDEVTDGNTAMIQQRMRCAAIAQTKIEEGAMWAVKAATKGPMITKTEPTDG